MEFAHSKQRFVNFLIQKNRHSRSYLQHRKCYERLQNVLMENPYNVQSDRAFVDPLGEHVVLVQTL